MTMKMFVPTTYSTAQCKDATQSTPRDCHSYLISAMIKNVSLLRAAAMEQAPVYGVFGMIGMCVVIKHIHCYGFGSNMHVFMCIHST